MFNKANCAKCNKPASDSKHFRGAGWTHDALLSGGYVTQSGDPLVQAVIAREVAEDDYFAAEWYLSLNRDEGTYRKRTDRERVAKAQNAMIDARMVAMLEADAAGLINLFDKGGDVELRTVEIMRFSGMNPENSKLSMGA